MSLALRAQRTARIRLLHTSAKAHDLVGPPDPTSHIRPVLYDTAPPPPRTKIRHPYSLKEFTDDTRDHELQWKLARQQLDAFNHTFWAESNTRFEAAKQSVLDSVPETADVLSRERALSEFYKKWVMQESRRQAEYSAEWRKRNAENILLAARTEYQRLKERISATFSLSTRKTK
ncbi:hypothetical protein BV22DRAFT_1018724 [Leucogyrophana mollusca]|uniref:Uncharacterized protein n=1 Tax=Leucogyrophana mollusca TaxID=85980 RepID=A0ACB8BA27_9AGAM|nr:hypothetical protein BV22DRAFT_1018724 [Leucogyrophana mollusca]